MAATNFPLTNLLKKSCFALLTKVSNDANLDDNIHLSASMIDGWQRKSIVIEPILARHEPFLFTANIVDKTKFNMEDFQTLLAECTEEGLVPSIEIIDDCDITDTMTIGMAWKVG